MKFIAIIPAAGRGSRLQASVPKQYLSINGTTLIEFALRPFIDNPYIEQIIVVLASDDRIFATLPVAGDPKIRTTLGGDSRMQSVINGLECYIDNLGQDEREHWVAVHDAARPLLHQEDLQACLDCCLSSQIGAILAQPVADTIKSSTPAINTDFAMVANTVPRESLWSAHTPQIFHSNKLLAALSQVVSQQLLVTDEAQAMELSGAPVQLVATRHPNFKVTRQADLALAKLVLAARQGVNSVI